MRSCTEPTCTFEGIHTHCCQCAVLNVGTTQLCVHHAVVGDDWAAANRIFCAWLHRHIEPPQVPWVEAPSVEWSDAA